MEFTKKGIVARNKKVVTPRWDKEKEQYICQHCGEEVSASTMSLGYDCDKCGLPIHVM